MPSVYLSFLLLFITCSPRIGICQDGSHEEINKLEATWKSTLPEATKNYYHYYWGPNYEFDAWRESELKTDTLFLFKGVVLKSHSKVGYLVYEEYGSPSGDWFIVANHYFDIAGHLRLIDWKMNTFYGDVTVTKRIYYGDDGQELDRLVSVYEMNTNIETKQSFMDREIEPILRYADLPFLKSR